MVVLEKKEKNALLMDITVNSDVRVEEKRRESDEVSVSRLRSEEAVAVETTVKVISVVVGALGTIPKKLELYVEKERIEALGGCTTWDS